MRQLNEIYHPYLTEIDSFQLFTERSLKINPINVAIGSNIPQNSIIRQHNHDTVYRMFINPLQNYGTLRFYSDEFYIKNLNLPAGDYTFATELFAEYASHSYRLFNLNITLSYVTGHNGIIIKKNRSSIYKFRI